MTRGMRGLGSRALAAVAAALVVLPAAALAQGAAQIGVAGDISTTALTVAQVSDLSFGPVIPGVPTTINPKSSASAGEYEITGNRNAEIAVTMTLPAQLSTGFWTMPISFGATSGCWRTNNAQGACTFWNPSTVLIQRIRNQNFPNNRFFVWMGGTVSPSPTQNPGMYLGNIMLSVVYTGN